MMKKLLLIIALLPLIGMAQTYKNQSDNIYWKGYNKFKNTPMITNLGGTVTDTVASKDYVRDLVTPVQDELNDSIDLYTAISNLTVVKLPTLTTTQINNISSPINGMVVFNSSTGDLWLYSGAWYKLTKATP